MKEEGISIVYRSGFYRLKVVADNGLEYIHGNFKSLEALRIYYPVALYASVEL